LTFGGFRSFRLTISCQRQRKCAGFSKRQVSDEPQIPVLGFGGVLGLA